jgi:hypothetical protein
MNAHTRIETINLKALRLDIWNAVATGKIAEFENQSYRLGHVLRQACLDARTPPTYCSTLRQATASYVSTATISSNKLWLTA